MASSFHIFRRNQKLMLAILTLMAMFAFVFLDPLMRILGSRQAPTDPVVAETKYGNLKRSDIDHLVATRGLVERFLKRLADAVVKKYKDQDQFRYAWEEQFALQRTQSVFLGEVMRSMTPQDTRATVDTMLLARRAAAENISVSNAAINAVIERLTNNLITYADLAPIISSLGGEGRRLTDSELFDALRTELAATAVAKSFAISINATPPGEAWDFFKRLNQKAIIEAIGVNVDTFADRVPAPSDAELMAFFEKHKDQIAIPGSPEPGFKLPRRQQFQYFLAEFDIFSELAKVTDEEVAKYYEENKESFKKSKLPEDKTSDEKAEEPPGDADEPPAETPEPPAATEGSEPKEPASPPSEEPKEESPQADEPEADEPAKDNPAKTEGDSVERSTRPQGVKFRLVADEKPVNDSEEADKAPAAAESATDKPAEDKPAGETPGAEKPVEEKAGEEKSAEKSTDEKPSDEPEYEPLEGKVKEDIIRSLKRDKAKQKINESLQDLASQLSDYSDARANYDPKDASSEDPPQEPDFEALSKQYGLTLKKSPLVSFFELDSSKGLGSSRYGNLPFAVFAFRETTLTPYAPIISEDTEGNVYLSWTLKEEPEQVPTFEDARVQVLRTWKLIKARDLARKQAEIYAAEAAGAKKDLSEVFKDEKGFKVITAGPFSWMTLGTTADNMSGGVPMLSEVVGIESPSNEFMQTTFGLPEGEIGVAMNGPKDICYVVQVVNYEPSTEQLERDFAGENFFNYLGVVRGEQQKLMRTWMASVERDAELKWIEEPKAGE